MHSVVEVAADGTDGAPQLESQLSKPELEDFRKKELKEQFDTVKSLEDAKLSASELNAYETPKKVLKVVTMLVVFLVLLTATLISKGATFLMVSQE